MTISGYSNVIVDAMLGWLKGFANWVLRLFNLAGSATTSPLYWLSQNWLKLLVFFMIVGVSLDLLIWIIRWRPYWVWFRKERVIINDDRFLDNAAYVESDGWEDDGELEKNWQERDYVVASTVVRRKSGDKAKGAVVRSGKRPADRQARYENGRAASKKRGKQEATTGKKRKPSKPGTRPSGRTDKRPHSDTADARKAAAKPEVKDYFALDINRPDVADSYEDEVFNVSNLPVSDEYKSDKKS